MAKSSSSSTASGGTSIAGLLGVAFVVLKLTGVIDWSWWWVTAPFWGGLAIGLTLVAVGGALVLLGTGVAVLLDNRNRKLAQNKSRKRLG